jgi:hypothetical protein
MKRTAKQAWPAVHALPIAEPSTPSVEAVPLDQDMVAILETLFIEKNQAQVMVNQHTQKFQNAVAKINRYLVQCIHLKGLRLEDYTFDENKLAFIPKTSSSDSVKTSN